MVNKLIQAEIAVDQLAPPSLSMAEGASVGSDMGTFVAQGALEDGSPENVLPIVRKAARRRTNSLFIAAGAAQMHAREMKALASARRLRRAVA